MKKKILIAMAIVIGLTTTSALALASNHPAKIVSKVTGRNVDDVMDERNNSNKSYGQIANEEGKLKEFKELKLKEKKKHLDNQVKNRNLTRKEANQYYSQTKQRMNDCDGTGYNQENNTRHHQGQGDGSGFGNHNGQGKGHHNRNR